MCPHKKLWAHSGTFGGVTVLQARNCGSIPDSVIVSFHCHSPSSHTMVLGLTQPVTEMSTRNTSFMC